MKGQNIVGCAVPLCLLLRATHFSQHSILFSSRGSFFSTGSVNRVNNRRYSRDRNTYHFNRNQRASL